MPRFISREKQGLFGGKYIETQVKPTDFERGQQIGARAVGALQRTFSERAAIRSGTTDEVIAALQAKNVRIWKRWILGGLVLALAGLATSYLLSLAVLAVVAGRLYLAQRTARRKIAEAVERNKPQWERDFEQLARDNPKRVLALVSTAKSFGVDEQDRLAVFFQAISIVQAGAPPEVLTTLLAGKLGLTLDISAELAQQVVDNVLSGRLDSMYTNDDVRTYLGAEYVQQNPVATKEMAKPNIGTLDSEPLPNVVHDAQQNQSDASSHLLQIAAELLANPGGSLERQLLALDDLLKKDLPPVSVALVWGFLMRINAALGKFDHAQNARIAFRDQVALLLGLDEPDQAIFRTRSRGAWPAALESQFNTFLARYWIEKPWLACAFDEIAFRISFPDGFREDLSDVERISAALDCWKGFLAQPNHLGLFIGDMLFEAGRHAEAVRYLDVVKDNDEQLLVLISTTLAGRSFQQLGRLEQTREQGRRALAAINYDLEFWNTLLQEDLWRPVCQHWQASAQALLENSPPAADGGSSHIIAKALLGFLGLSFLSFILYAIIGNPWKSSPLVPNQSTGQRVQGGQTTFTPQQQPQSVLQSPRDQEAQKVAINNLIADWKRARENRNFNQFISFYDPSFSYHAPNVPRQNKEQSFGQWWDSTQQQFQNPSKVQREFHSMNITFSGNTALAEFIEEGRLDQRAYRGKSTLNFQMLGDTWKIVRQNWVLDETHFPTRQWIDEYCYYGEWHENVPNQFRWTIWLEKENDILQLKRNDGFASGSFQRRSHEWAGELYWGNGTKWANVVLYKANEDCNEIRINQRWWYKR